MASDSTNNNSNRTYMDVIDAFISWDSCGKLLEQIEKAVTNVDPTITVLALEGLYRIEDTGMRRGQFIYNQYLSKILQAWRRDAPLSLPYSAPTVSAVLRCLKIFTCWKIPHCVENSGQKLPLSTFGVDDVEDIDIDGRTVLLLKEDTIEVDADYKQKGWHQHLSQLPIRGLCQGEIVYHSASNEVHVILYATDKDGFVGLKKPTLDGVRRRFKCDTAQIKIRLINKPLSEKQGSMAEAMLDLTQAFVCRESCDSFLAGLLNELKKIEDPAICGLALEGLYRLEEAINKDLVHKTHSLPLPVPSEESPHIKAMQGCLQKWRSLFDLEYDSRPFAIKDFMIRFLRSLTIFKTLQVPLFIDDYGAAKPLHYFTDEELETITINGDMDIIHVAHRKEAKSIADEKKFQPSDNKNSVEGTWFGLVEIRSEDSLDGLSPYGSKGFRTTLSQLGVTGLYQGEIVYYYNERNTILYATDDSEADFEGLKKPLRDKEESYVKVSIFVPARFLPSTDKFWTVVNELVYVDHGPFCVPEKRKQIQSCPDGYKRRRI